MNECKLSKSALTYAADVRNVYENIPEIDLNNIEDEAFTGFHNGARWHESLPLADRLRESEKERIREFYKAYHDSQENGFAHGYTGCRALESIFGMDLFEEYKK